MSDKDDGGRMKDEGGLIFYQTSEGAVRIEVLYELETFWMSQKKIAELFGVDVRTISEHLQNVYASGELVEEATLRKIRRVQIEGNREVRREIEFYNLDAIISVGYRVNSAQATQFRIWATQTLREFVIKGFVLDAERLTNAGSVSAEVAKRLAEEQYATFRVQQDRHFESDFEKEVKRISGKNDRKPEGGDV
jgi:hypothetical protein